MIISHKYKFIFIRTRKTAGTSIEIELSKFCGEEDVITPISLKDEAIRRKLGHRGPQNYIGSWLSYEFKDWVRLVTELQRKKIFAGHMPAKEIRQKIGEDIWNRYFKFCFERNPWDKVISFYFFQHGKEPRPLLSEFILSGEASQVSDYDLYTCDGKIIVDYIGRYENLKSELEFIDERLGFPERLQLPWAKGDFREDRRHYRLLLGDEEKKRISIDFANEISYLGYEF